MKKLSLVLILALITLVLLEALLTAAGLPTWYPRHLPAIQISMSPWWTCDAPGCHYVYAAIQPACQSGELRGRACRVNRQGYSDSDDFVAPEFRGGQARILILGDSFAFGMNADRGESFVETLEARLPDSLIWNLGIPGSGTKQAIAAFDVYAPLLQPQLTLLAFFTNDFDDNLLPVDSWLNAVRDDGSAINLRRFKVDRWENVVEYDLRAIQLLTIYGKEPPANEAQRQLGLTRLGTLILRLAAVIEELRAPQERFERRRQATRDFLRTLRERARTSDSDLLALLIPSLEDLDEVGPRYQLARQLMTELGIAFLEPRALLDRDTDYEPPDIHWTSAGHQKVGALLAECVDAYLVSGDLNQCLAAAE